MIKSLFALLLIAGIIMAAHFSPATGNENSNESRISKHVEWWHTNLAAYLATRHMHDVPWLHHVSGTKAQKTPAGLLIDSLEPLRLQSKSPPTQLTSSGQFSTP